MRVCKEMNDTIKDIYSKSEDFQQQYVLAWINELEKKVEFWKDIAESCECNNQ